MRLFLAVPNDAACAGRVARPAVGVPPPHLHSPARAAAKLHARGAPVAYRVCAALVAVSAIFLFSVYARAKKR